MHVDLFHHVLEVEADVAHPKKHIKTNNYSEPATKYLFQYYY